MLATPSPNYVRPRTRDASLSPSCRAAFTPPRLGTPAYTMHARGSPLLTPSPYRRRALFPSATADAMDTDGGFSLRSPFASPPPRQRPGVRRRPARPVSHPLPITADDEDGGIFLAAPLRTPVKPVFSPPPHAVLTPVRTNAPALDVASTRVGGGTKRKPSSAAGETTPIRTPLSTTSDAFAFDRLAPLSAPRFVARTPQSKAETETFLKKQTRTMTRLRLCDRDDSGVGSELEEDNDGEAEVIAAVSPDGHVSKRRARSRPVSAELLDSVPFSPSPPVLQIPFPSRLLDSPSSPSTASSPSSSEAGSPVRQRRMISGTSARGRHRTQSHLKGHLAPPPLNRLPSSSSATLFFGPAIPDPRASKTSSPDSSPVKSDAPPSSYSRPRMMNRHSYAGGSSSIPWGSTPAREPGPSSSFMHESPTEEEDMFFSNPADSSFTFSVASADHSPSPRKKHTVDIAKKYKPRDSGVCLSEDESFRMGDADFGPVPSASTSVSTVQSSSGDEAMGALVTPMFAPSEHSAWPSALIFGADGEGDEDRSAEPAIDAFIKRTLAAAAREGASGARAAKRAPGTPVKKVKTAFLGARPWQSAMMMGKVGFAMGGEDEEKENDAPAAGKAGKRKKPRASMPAAFPEADRQRAGAGPGKRMGLGMTLGAIGLGRSGAGGDDTESEDDKDSPSMRKQGGRFHGLGLGRPSAGGMTGKARWLMRRTSSGQFESGNESAGSAGTPTRLRSKASALRIQTQFSPSHTSKLSSRMSSGSGSTSGMSTATLNSPTMSRSVKGLPISGPRTIQHRQSSAELFRDYVHISAFKLPLGRSQVSGNGAGFAHNVAPPTPGPPMPIMPRARMASMSAEDHRSEWFEHQFTEIDEVGSGEFGKVLKVRRKDGPEGEVFAVKKSGKFEGTRHRLRLREEVDILKHLSRAAEVEGLGGRHPNILAYVDSWEQGEALYIQTELCELGNFARFLWEFGRHYARLDEGRVWKICADLSSGLRFMHDNGVIHLDLKPANIFVTGEGRFKIGDFGMASLWPRPPTDEFGQTAQYGQGRGRTSFEREGDKLYLAAEVLQGRYGKEADMFSFGMIMLETATNIVVPDQGDAWHRLREEDFGQVELEDGSPELSDLIRSMMRTDPAARATIADVHGHFAVARARAAMERVRARVSSEGGDPFAGSPLAGAPDGFLAEVLGRAVLPAAGAAAGGDGDDADAMDVSA